MKTTNEWIVCDIIRPFGDKEMLILKIKQYISESLPLGSLKTGFQEL